MTVAASTRYGPVAQAAHWLTFLLVACVFLVGITMEDLPVSPDRVRLFSYHKWLGVTIFLVVALRLAWRWRHPPPPLPAAMPTWERHAARLMHVALYFLLFAVPLSGWLMSSAKGFQTVYFGVLPIPDLLAKDKPLGEELERLHWLLNKTLLMLALLHALAALKHHYVNRDDVLARMTPGLSPRIGGAP